MPTLVEESVRRSRPRARVKASAAPVAVFDADSPPALAFARSLGRAGVAVTVYSRSRVSVTGASRFATSWRRCPDASEVEPFHRWLEGEVKAGNIGWIAPTSDLIVFHTVEVRHLLPAGMRDVTPGLDSLLDVLFKDRFGSACAAIHQPTPWSLCPRSREEVLASAHDLPYPLILKPRSHVGVGIWRGVVASDEESLREVYQPYSIRSGNAAVLERFPELRWPMLQEYVPDALRHLFSISGVVGREGEVTALAVTRKISQWPPRLGVGTLFEGSDDAEVMRVGARIAKALIHRGLFELELIRDPRSGQLLAIDLNPRAFGQISLDIARGHDLPLLWDRLATGAPLPEQPPPRDGVRWVHSIPFNIGHWIGLLSGPGRARKLRDYLAALAPGDERVDIVNDLRDPLPTVVFTARMLRHPGGLVRPFLSTNF